MRERLDLLAVAGCCLLLLLTSCTAIPPAPTTVDYRLELTPGSVTALPHHPGVLRIARPQADAGADTRGIAYRSEPHQIRYYTKSRWADTPARMLATVLSGAFESSGLFDAVVDNNRLPADYLLTTRLRRLEQLIAEDGKGAVQLQLRLQLIQLPERNLLGSWLIETEAPTAQDNAAAAVMAANQALAQATTRALQEINAALTQAATAR